MNVSIHFPTYLILETSNHLFQDSGRPTNPPESKPTCMLCLKANGVPILEGSVGSGAFFDFLPFSLSNNEVILVDSDLPRPGNSENNRI